MCYSAAARNVIIRSQASFCIRIRGSKGFVAERSVLIAVRQLSHNACTHLNRDGMPGGAGVGLPAGIDRPAMRGDEDSAGGARPVEERQCGL